MDTIEGTEAIGAVLSLESIEYNEEFDKKDEKGPEQKIKIGSITGHRRWAGNRELIEHINADVSTYCVITFR